MDAVYHTFNRYLPAVGRILQVLQSYGPAGTTLQVCNRDLARAAQCSAGRVPALLRTLEADGEIERITSPQGSLIVVLGDDTAIVDRPTQSDQGIVDRSMADPTEDRSAMVDPPTPPNRYKQQQQHGARYDWSNVTISGADFIPTQALEKAGVTPEILQSAAAKIQTRQEYTPRTRASILFDCLLRHQPIYSASEIAGRSEETSHERPGRSVQPTHAPHRRGRSVSDPEPNEARDAEYRAQLAKFERAAAARRAANLPGV